MDVQRLSRLNGLPPICTRSRVLIFESAGEPTFGILLEMVGDGVGMEVEDLGNKAVSSPFMMHPNDQEFGLILIGSRRVVECFGNVGQVLVSEF